MRTSFEHEFPLNDHMHFASTVQLVTPLRFIDQIRSKSACSARIPGHASKHTSQIEDLALAFSSESSAAGTWGMSMGISLIKGEQQGKKALVCLAAASKPHAGIDNGRHGTRVDGRMQRL